MRVPLGQLLEWSERRGDEERDEPDDGADEVVSAPSGGGGVAGPSDAAPPARVPTASDSAASGMDTRTPIELDVYLEWGCASFASVVRRFLMEVGLRPDEGAGATYYELCSYVKALLRSATAIVGVGSSTSCGAGPSSYHFVRP